MNENIMLELNPSAQEAILSLSPKELEILRERFNLGADRDQTPPVDQPPLFKNR